MPFCPKCRYEYEFHVSVCPDCEEQLVGSLPEERSRYTPLLSSAQPDLMNQYADWVQIARLTSERSANMIMEVWQSKDIPGVVLSGAGHFGQIGLSSYLPMDGGYCMMVPRKFVEDADGEATAVLGEEWENARLGD